MLVNDIHIQGMFLYNSEATYEKGDFVVKGDTIFVCSPIGTETIKGIDPEVELNSGGETNYKIYLGERLASIQDFVDYASGNGKTEVGSKYIDLKTLPGILNQYMVGFDGNGVIRQFLNEDGYSLYNPATGQLDEVFWGKRNYRDDPTKPITTTENILDLIFTDPLLNNSIFFISKNFSGINSLLPLGSNSRMIRPEGGIGNDGTKVGVDWAHLEDCILRQYTYINGFGVSEDGNRYGDGRYESYYHRLQELIDPATGMIFYRVTPQIAINGKSLDQVLEEIQGTNFINDVKWNSVFPGGGAGGIQETSAEVLLTKQWSHVINFYQQEVNNYQELQTYLSNRFGFKPITVEEGKKEITLVKGTGGLLEDPETLTGVTIRALYRRNGQSLYRSCEITVDMTSSIKEYLINDDVKLVIDGAKITISKGDNVDVEDSSLQIASIYYREHYQPQSQKELNPYPSVNDLITSQQENN